MPLLQEISALALVALAAGYLAWRGWQVVVRNRAGGCGGGGCSVCPGNSSRVIEPHAAGHAPAGFVPLDQLEDPRGGGSSMRVAEDCAEQPGDIS